MQHQAMQQLGVEDHSKAPPLENFREAAERRVRLGLLVNQLVADNSIVVDPQRLKRRVEEMCAGYEKADDMVSMYMSNPQIVQQVEPMVLEQQAIDWLAENGKMTDRQVSFTDYMNPKEDK